MINIFLLDVTGPPGGCPTVCLVCVNIIYCTCLQSIALGEVLLSHRLKLSMPEWDSG